MAANDPECKGCKSYIGKTPKISCSIPSVINGKECPCLTCLVKGVCEIWEECPLYKEHLLVVIEWKRKME